MKDTTCFTNSVSKLNSHTPSSCASSHFSCRLVLARRPVIPLQVQHHDQALLGEATLDSELEVFGRERSMPLFVTKSSCTWVELQPSLFQVFL